MDIEPKTRREHFLARAAGDENALALQPKTREEHLLQNIIDAIEEGGGSGSVTPASIVTATGQMTSQQASQTRANIGATDAATSIPDNVKQALLACFADVAWADDQGQTHYDALEAALYPLDHITAVYTQSGTVYDTDSLDNLKTDLVVTAVYEGGNTETVSAANYTLSGTLTVGTSTITVSYGGKTTTFDVTVATHFLYKLENYAFNNEYIDTGLTILSEDKDFTIAMDINISTNPTSGIGSQVRYMAVVNHDGSGFALTFGKGQATSGNYSGGFMGPYEMFSATGAGRLRVVYKHTKNSGNAFIKSRKDTETAVSHTINGTFTATEYHLAIGRPTDAQKLPTGTINKAYVYDYAMSDSEINSFLGL